MEPEVESGHKKQRDREKMVPKDKPKTKKLRKMNLRLWEPFYLPLVIWASFVAQLFSQSFLIFCSELVVQSFAKRMHWSLKTPSSKNTREDSTHGHHQMVNTEIRWIIFFAAKDGKVSKNKSGSKLWLRT